VSDSRSSDWIEVAEARSLPGLRLVLTAGVPGPWGEAAKGVFRVKGIPFARVRQLGGQGNDDLFAWTGHRNAPVAVFERERPRTGWVEILALAERLAPEPALVPRDPEQRVLMFGLAHELMSEGGFGWCRRLMLFRQSLGDSERSSEPVRRALSRMLEQYDYSREAAERAPARLAEILTLLAERLHAQLSRGQRYLMGERLTALDLYSAAMLGITAPLSQELCPMSAPMRAMYGSPHPALQAALDPALLEHRDRIYRDHMGLPIEL
jgi:glutathione S-transferase